MNERFISTESQAPAENERTPFVIRGHHLKKFARMELIAQNTSIDVPITQELAETERQILEMSFVHPRKYRIDMIGKTRKSADTYQQNAQALYERFLELPDDHPVDIVEGIKDEFCNSCPFVGSHCNHKNHEGFNGIFIKRYGGDAITGDGHYIDDFLEITGKDGYKPVIEEDIAVFVDASPEKARRVKTDMHTVKKYFNSFTLVKSPYSMD